MVYYGPNGAGKTTTIECALGIKNIDAGRIEILGQDPKKDRKKLFERIGVQFQSNGYQDKIKVQEVCELMSGLYKNPKDWEELLAIFKLEARRRNLVSELSGGERQKLSVLLALIPNPEIVFLDELTTGLDTKARREIWKYLKALKKEGLTMVITSHYMDEVETLCDRIAIIRNCEVVVMGTVQEVIQKSPYHTLEKAYLWYLGEESVLEDESI